MSGAPDALAAVCERIDATRHLNAVLAWDRRTVLAQAGGKGPLGGVAVALKDNICSTEYPTTCGSRMLEGYVPPRDATVVTRLRAAGAVIACKTNMDEFAMGSSTEHSAFGPTRHPEAPDRVPGGSSGGSAALVAAGAVPVALGSDTGGSVRQPAALCGVVGLKPTYGRVSRSGLVAFASSLDQIGILARDVGAAARVLAVIAGRDPEDATTADHAPFVPEPVPVDLTGLVIGVVREYFPDDLDPGVRAGCGRALALLRDAGAEVREVSLPHTPLAVPCYCVLASAEASSNLARFDGARYGRRIAPDDPTAHGMYRATRGTLFGSEVRRRILMGTYVLSAGPRRAYYERATAVRRLIARDFARAFRAGADLLFTPTTSAPAFRAGEKLDDPVAMYRTDVFVCAANLAGVPAVSLPVGRVDGLPVAAQLMGPPFEEDRMLAAAGVLARRLDPAREVR